MPERRNPCPRSHEIYKFCRPFFDHHYYIFSLSDLCLGVEKKIFLRNTSILHFLPQNYLPLWMGVMKWNLQFLVSLPYRCYIQNLFKIGPVVLEEKVLTHDGWGLTPIHSNRSPELILRWPKKGMTLNLTKFESLHPPPKMLCTKFSWDWHSDLEMKIKMWKDYRQMNKRQVMRKAY